MTSLKTLKIIRLFFSVFLDDFITNFEAEQSTKSIQNYFQIKNLHVKIAFFFEREAEF